MMYFGKQKVIRRNQWVAVPSPKIETVNDAHSWCRLHQSAGKFYHHYSNTRWWFELESDAILFSLKWSGR